VQATARSMYRHTRGGDRPFGGKRYKGVGLGHLTGKVLIVRRDGSGAAKHDPEAC